MAVGIALMATAASALAQGNAAPPSLLVLNLELVDSSGEVTDQRADHERRLAAVREILTTELAARDVYTVVDPAPVQAEIDATRQRQYLHACNGCEIGFAREVSSRTVFLHQGRIEEEGPPKDLFGNPRSERLRQFLASHL